jgi:O-antigen/teichoic acid export membrane protein
MSEHQSKPEPAPDQARSTSLLFVAQLLAAAGAFITTVIIARTLGPAGRGIYAFAVTVASIVAIAGQAGLSSAISFATAQNPSRRRKIRRFYLLNAGSGSLLLGVGIAILMMAEHGLLPKGSDANKTALLIGFIAFAVTVFDGAFAFRSAEQRFGEAALMLTVGGIAPALLVVGLDLAGVLTTASALAAWGGARIVIGAAGWVYPRLLASTGKPEPELPRAMRSYGRRAFLASAAGVLTLRADQWVLGLMSGGATLGIYAVAVSVSDPGLYIPTALQRVLFPRVVGEGKRAVELTSRSIRVAIVLVSMFVVCAGPLGYVLLPVVFGDAFNAARTPFLVLLPGAFGITVLILASAAIAAFPRPGLASIIEIGTSFTMLALDVALIPSFKATGAAVACTIAYTFGGVVALVAFRRIHAAKGMKIVPGREDVQVVGAFSRERLAALRSARRKEQIGS